MAAHRKRGSRRPIQQAKPSPSGGVATVVEDNTAKVGTSACDHPRKSSITRGRLSPCRSSNAALHATPGNAPMNATKHLSGANQGSTRGIKEQTVVPALSDVLRATESLYDDELKPFGRILRKRIAERAVMKATGSLQVTRLRGPLPDVSISHLRSLCESCPHLHVTSEEGGDWSVQIIGREPKFVDVYSPEDSYPESLWKAALAYFSELQPPEMYLPGGRYLCAQELIERNLEFLKGCSLGKICHIVQLAISQKKILGYLNGSVVPYGRSLSMMKDQCAVWGQPCAKNPATTTSPNGMMFELASWERARECLQEILETVRAGPGMLPLSNVKRLFRSRFQLELSETMLGHAKLLEMLQDPRFSDLCEVRLTAKGYMVVPSTQLRSGTESTASSAYQRGSSSSPEVRHQDCAQTSDPCLLNFRNRPTPLILEDAESQSSGGPNLSDVLGRGQLDGHSNFGMSAPRLSPSSFLSSSGVRIPCGRTHGFVRNTFIDAGPPPLTPQPGALLRSKSLPKNVGSERNEWEPTYSELNLECNRSDPDKIIDTTIDFNCGTELFAPTPLGFQGIPATPTPLPSPAHLESSNGGEPEMDTPVKVMLFRRSCVQPMQFPSFEGTSQSGAEKENAPVHHNIYVPKPSERDSLDYVGEQNLLSPSTYGARRSHSLPKDVGSGKLEADEDCERIVSGSSQYDEFIDTGLDHLHVSGDMHFSTPLSCFSAPAIPATPTPSPSPAYQAAKANEPKRLFPAGSILRLADLV